MNHIITIPRLIARGFKISAPAPWITLNHPDRYMELTQGGEGYWYPVLVKEPEVSSESTQRFPCNRIKYMHELERLYSVLTGEPLPTQKSNP